MKDRPATGLEDVLQASRAALGLAGFVSSIVPDEYASARHALPSGEVAIDTWIEVHPAGHEARMALIRSPKIEIVTAFLYPAATCAVPLYAMELVRLGPRPVVAVMDCAAPAEDPAMPAARALLDAVRAEAPDLLPADDPPDWYTQSRSGADLFQRPASVADLHRAALQHLLLWGTLLLRVECAGPRSVAAAAAFSAFVSRYKDHHRTHSPGIPLLTKCFGADWTASYLSGCFFR